MQKFLLVPHEFVQAGITSRIAGYLTEAAIFCLAENGHKPGVELELKGDYTTSILLYWSNPNLLQLQRSWQDKNEAAEYAATCIAVGLIKELTPFEIIARAQQKGGVDYLLGIKGSLKISAFLEVSGIFTGRPGNSMHLRFNKKEQKINAEMGLIPVYLIVVEFGAPQSKIIKYD